MFNPDMILLKNAFEATSEEYREANEKSAVIHRKELNSDLMVLLAMIEELQERLDKVENVQEFIRMCMENPNAAFSSNFIHKIKKIPKDDPMGKRELISKFRENLKK
jgi:hypothetical protein